MVSSNTRRHVRRLRPALGAPLLLALLPAPAMAYVGPGLGAGAIGALLGVVGAIFLALFAVVYYPVKRLMRSRSKSRGTAKTSASGD